MVTIDGNHVGTDGVRLLQYPLWPELCYRHLHSTVVVPDHRRGRGATDRPGLGVKPTYLLQQQEGQLVTAWLCSWWWLVSRGMARWLVEIGIRPVRKEALLQQVAMARSP